MVGRQGRPHPVHVGSTPARVAAALVAIATLAPGAATAAGRFVAPGGNDSNSGSISQPWRTLTSALTRLNAGDTLYVRAGRYFESPVASRSGTAPAPIVVRAYPGESPVVDSGYPEFQTPGNGEWELVDAATGEYRSLGTYGGDDRTNGYVVPAFPYADDRVALIPYANAAHFRATTDLYNPIAFYVGPGTFDDPDGRIHIRLAKTSDLVATESRYGPIFSTSLPDPNDLSILISRASHTLRVTGSYLTFVGLTLETGHNTIELGPGVHDVSFDGVTAWLGNRAIEAEETGIHHITVTRCRIYGDHPWWLFWSDMKDAPYPADLFRATSIDLRAGTHDWEISYSHIRGCGQDLIGTADAEYNLSIHHNRFENAGDDALELEGSLGRAEIYENLFVNCLVAAAPGQSSPGFTGPLYFYRNVVASLRNPPVNREEGINTWNGGGRYGYEYAMKQAGTGFGTRDMHVYHNTFVLLNSGGKGINLTPQFPESTRVANNLLVTVNGPVNGSYTSGAGQVVDGNLYWKMNTVENTHLVWSYDTVPALSSATGFETHGLGSVPRRGTNPGFLALPIQVVNPSAATWEITAASERLRQIDFFLGASSPARGAGIVIPPHPVHGALPDSRVSRDIGAIPYGTPSSTYDYFPFNPDAGPPVLDAPRFPPAEATSSVSVTPHPVRSRARVHFSNAAAGPVRLELLDVQGRVARVLLDTAWLPAGGHTVEIDVRRKGSLSPGVYFARLSTPRAVSHGKLLIVE